MATYELMVVFDGQRSDEDLDTLLERIDKLIAQHGGEITHRDDWGRRKLAYEIDRKVDGFYSVRHFVQSDGTAALAHELEMMERLEEALLRHLLVKVPRAKRPQPVLSKPDPAADARPEWGVARRGWRPPHRHDRSEGGRGGREEARRDEPGEGGVKDQDRPKD